MTLTEELLTEIRDLLKESRGPKKKGELERDWAYPLISCPKCGIRWDGPMGYVCPDPECPSQPRIA